MNHSELRLVLREDFRISDPQGNAYDIFTDPEFTDANASLNLYVQWATADYYGGDENGLVHGARINDDLSIPCLQQDLADARVEAQSSETSE